MDEPPGIDTFNEWYSVFGLFPTKDKLQALVLEAEKEDKAGRPYSLLAFYVLGMWFNKSGAHDGFHECLSEAAEGMPPDGDYKRVGYDALQVEWYADVRGVGCSPLLCNGCHKEHPVNEECLLDTLEQALEVGKIFGATQPEPGDYLIIEVWRKFR